MNAKTINKKKFSCDAKYLIEIFPLYSSLIEVLANDYPWTISSLPSAFANVLLVHGQAHSFMFRLGELLLYSSKVE